MDKTGSPDGGGLPRRMVPSQFSASGPDPDGQRDAVITGQADIAAMTSALRRSSLRDWMTLHNHVVPPVDWDALDVPASGDVRTRAIYDSGFVENPEGLSLVRKRAAAGEEARLYEGVSFNFRLADSCAALLVMPFLAKLAILVLNQPGPRGLRESFELIWEDATAFEATRPGLISSPRLGWLN